MRVNKKRAEFLREIADRFALATGRSVVEVSEVVAWGQQHEDIGIPRPLRKKLLEAEMSAALNDHTMKDRQGRVVRVRLAVKTKRMDANGKTTTRHLWSRIELAPDEFQREAMQQMRESCAADVDALKANLENVNEIRAAKGWAPIRLSFDFGPQASDSGAADVAS